MSVLIEKIFGYILFYVGLACILFASFSMYHVFTDTSKPPDIFQLQSVSLTTTPSGTSQPVKIDVPLSPEARKIVNMFLYYLLMLFMVIVGSRISSLGIQFAKEIKVKMKS